MARDAGEEGGGDLGHWISRGVRVEELHAKFTAADAASWFILRH
jgi:hypothetical protein